MDTIDRAELDKLIASARASFGATLAESSLGNVALSSSLSDSSEIDAGGMQRGEVADLPHCPAVDCLETIRVAGNTGDVTAFAVSPIAARPSSGDSSSPSKQLRLRLPQDTVEAIQKLPPKLRGHALMLALDSWLGDVDLLQDLVAAAKELLRVGVLLKQALSGGLPSELAARVNVVLQIIEQVRRVQQHPATTQLRLRLPHDLADKLSKLKPVPRERALSLALDNRISAVISRPKLISAQSELLQVGVRLNEELARGRFSQPEALAEKATNLILHLSQTSRGGRAR